ncbi:MAG TPA: hypothetical protein VFZ26_13250 [Gemmatimonadales bacterium]
MGWKEVAAGLGTQAAVSSLKAAKDQMSKRQYKRLLSTAVAQLLELHPDIGPKQARRRARRLTGARPSRKLMRAGDNFGWKEGAQTAVAAAATAGVARVAGVVGDKLKEKLGSAGEENGRQEGDGVGERPVTAAAAEGSAGRRDHDEDSG